MKKLIAVIICVIIAVCLSAAVIAYAADNSAKPIPDTADPAVIQTVDDDQALHDRLAAEKEAALADYVPEETVVADYFYMAAEKLGVDTDGLSPDELIAAVKAAEVAMMQAYDPANDTDIEQMMRDKEALLK